MANLGGYANSSCAPRVDLAESVWFGAVVSEFLQFCGTAFEAY